VGSARNGAQKNSRRLLIGKFELLQAIRFWPDADSLPDQDFAAEGLLEAVGPRNISIREDYIFSVSIREISSSKLEES
jgi:hypothetical protein